MLLQSASSIRILRWSSLGLDCSANYNQTGDEEGREGESKESREE